MFPTVLGAFGPDLPNLSLFENHQVYRTGPIVVRDAEVYTHAQVILAHLLHHDGGGYISGRMPRLA